MIVSFDQYDTQGNPTRTVRSNEGEGFHQVRTNQFDEHGNLVHSQWSDYEYGLPATITYQWEAAGWGHLFALSPPAPANEIEEYEWPE